jgi:hypothetical protein
MGRRDDQVKAYIGALEIRPLVILAAVGGRPARIAAHPEKNLEQIDALYFAKPQHAELVLSHVLGDLDAVGVLHPHGWIDLPAREVRDTVANVAAYLGASFRSTAEVQRDAGAAVDRILASVEASRVSGGLTRVNAEYKAYRQRQMSMGQPAASYSKHLANFTRNVVLLAAQSANASRANSD